MRQTASKQDCDCADLAVPVDDGESVVGQGSQHSVDHDADSSSRFDSVDTVQEALPTQIRRAAMDALARREHSYVELQRKLRSKFADVPVEELQLQLDRLREQGLQSDTRFTESYIRYRKSRGFAYLHLRADLLGRGVSEQIVEEFLFPDDEDWLPMAEALVERRLLGEGELIFGSKTHRKLIRFLDSRGFPHSISRRALDAKLRR